MSGGTPVACRTAADEQILASLPVVNRLLSSQPFWGWHLPSSSSGAATRRVGLRASSHSTARRRHLPARCGAHRRAPSLPGSTSAPLSPACTPDPLTVACLVACRTVNQREGGAACSVPTCTARRHHPASSAFRYPSTGPTRRTGGLQGQQCSSPCRPPVHGTLAASASRPAGLPRLPLPCSALHRRRWAEWPSGIPRMAL